MGVVYIVCDDESHVCTRTCVYVRRVGARPPIRARAVVASVAVASVSSTTTTTTTTTMMGYSTSTANLIAALADDADALDEDEDEEARETRARRRHRSARGSAVRAGVDTRETFAEEDAVKKPLGVMMRDRRVEIYEDTDEKEVEGGGVGGGARRRAECGTRAKARVEACTALIRERVVSTRGIFRSEGAAFGMLLGQLAKTPRGREYSRGRAPAAGLGFLTRDEREEALDAQEKYDDDDNVDEWLEFAARVKYNAITRVTKPAQTSSSGYALGANYVECSLELFDAIGACNHSCEPNAAISRVSDDNEVTLYSLREIGAGEEITVCYGKPMIQWLPVRMRQKILKRDWGFTCMCRRCSFDLSYGIEQPTRPWDVYDSRWFFSCHDYITGFESHFDDEGNLMSLKLGGGGGADVAGGFSRSEGSSKTPLHDRDASSSSSSGFKRSSDDSETSMSDEDFEERDTTSGSEDEDVLRWHERWRSKRLSNHSVKNRGYLSPLTLYKTMTRCRIRQDHWQLMIVRDAVIEHMLNEAKIAPSAADVSKPRAPAIAGDRLKAFKLMLNHCRSLMRMAPNTAYFAKTFATLENFYFWHACEGTHAAATRRKRRRHRQRGGGGSGGVDGESAHDNGLLDIQGRWEFRLNALREGIHPDVMAYNVQFNQSPASPFWY